MAKQHELVAVEKEKTARLNASKTTLLRYMERAPFYFGLSKEYTADDEDGEHLPSESRKVQRDLMEDIADFANLNSQIMDLTVQKDATNCYANADIVIDGKVLAKEVPVTTLLSMEKLIQHYRSTLMKCPTLPKDQTWKLDETSGSYVTEEIKTSRSKKLEKPLMLAPATEHHPAQVKTTMVDTKVGTWAKRDLSSALPEKKLAALISRANKLLDAVKQARERANSVEVKDIQIGEELTRYLLSG